MTTKRVIEQNATPEDLDRFWAKVDMSGGPDACWPWTGSTATAGRYGTFYAPDGKRYRAHRWIYAQVIGIVDHQNDLDHVCHTEDKFCLVWDECEHHGCVNPAHLEEVTPNENNRRGNSFPAQNSRKTHCVRGHEFIDENTWVGPDGNRSCKHCHRDEMRDRGRIAAGIPLDAPLRRLQPKSKTHCAWGHERTIENLYLDGKTCRLCTKRYNDAKPRNGLHNVRPRKTHCKHGHEYTEENTYINAKGFRSCKVCRQERKRISNEHKRRNAQRGKGISASGPQ